ncbi:hypothetical protein BJX99DRAFT_256116, partial [Aspergillus californicus]
WIGIPYAIGGISELFVNVPAYGIAYSHAPPNMRGLVSAINLLNTAFAYAIGLACSAVIKDPYLTWDLGGPSIAGGILTVIFYFLFRHMDKEEFVLSENVQQPEYEKKGDLTEEGYTHEPAATTPGAGEEEIAVAPKY